MSETSRVPYLICEAANSHGGSEQAILELIARYAAIDYPNKGFKFQVFGAETIALPDFSWYSAYKELEFDKTTWTSLISTAAAHGDVWIDVFDRYALDIVRENIGRIAGLKLQPSILDNQEVLESLRTIDLDGKQLIINVSGFGLDDISRLIDSRWVFKRTPPMSRTRLFRRYRSFVPLSQTCRWRWQIMPMRRATLRSWPLYMPISWAARYSRSIFASTGRQRNTMHTLPLSPMKWPGCVFD